MKNGNIYLVETTQDFCWFPCQILKFSAVPSSVLPFPSLQCDYQSSLLTHSQAFPPLFHSAPNIIFAYFER